MTLKTGSERMIMYVFPVHIMIPTRNLDPDLSHTI